MTTYIELSNLEIRNLLLETLAYEGDDIDSDGKNFKMYGYQGSRNDLFRLFNGLIIKKGIRTDKTTIRDSSWGTETHLLFENSNISLSRNEILKLYQEFNNLIIQGVIAPGAYGSYGVDLPFFHLTEFGMKCIKETDILPYDQDRYLSKLQNINNLNEWIVFYLTEGLRCFNVNCINSSMINIGLAGETIVEDLASSFLNFLNKNDRQLATQFQEALDNPRLPVSTKYIKYIKYQEKYLKRNPNTTLSSYTSRLDNSSSQIYATFTRLNRNSVSHPNELVMDRIKVLMFFLSFVDYCELQYLFINYYKNNS